MPRVSLQSSRFYSNGPGNNDDDDDSGDESDENSNVASGPPQYEPLATVSDSVYGFMALVTRREAGAEVLLRDLFLLYRTEWEGHDHCEEPVVLSSAAFAEMAVSLAGPTSSRGVPMLEVVNRPRGNVLRNVTLQDWAA